MLEDRVHARALRRGHEILHRRVDPGLRRQVAKRPVQEDAAPLPIEERQPVRRALGDRLQRHLRLAQCRFRTLALGYVRDGDREGTDNARLDDRHDTMLMMGGIAVGAAMAQLDAARSSRGEYAPIQLLQARPVRCRNEVEEAAADHILRAELPELPVHEPHAQSLIDQEQPVRGVFGDGAQHGLRLQQRLLGQLPGRDVIGGAQHSGDLPGLWIAHGQHADVQPLLLPMDGAHAGLTALGLAPCKARLPLGRSMPLRIIDE